MRERARMRRVASGTARLPRPRIEQSAERRRRYDELTVAQASATLGVTTAQVLRMIHGGRLAARAVSFVRVHRAASATTRGALAMRRHREARREDATRTRTYFVPRVEVEKAARERNPRRGAPRTAATAAQVYALRTAGKSIRQIAESLGVSTNTVSRRIAEWR